MKKRRTESTKTKKEPTFKKKELVPKSKNQAEYIRCIVENHVTLCTGPAGSGKTAIATGMACEALLRHDVDRIVITRPVIESGKGLGFLPGNMLEKVNPYMVPIVEEMKLYLGDQMNVLKANNTIEICPLEYMRGRNFHNTFMILDEAQNCTFEQIKMFLTRIGVGSKVIINGDTDQSDLPEYTKGGFKTLLNKLQDLDGVGIAVLTNEDVVRNGIIPRILDRLKS